MTQDARQRWLHRGAVLALAATFLYAGGLKAWAPNEFALAIERYRLVPYQVSVVLALYLPWLEIAAALALFAPALRRAAAGLIALMLLAFCGALASAWVRGIDLACGCFSNSAEPSNIALHLGGNAILLVLAAALLRAPPTRRR